ncbi:amidase family protein, partial [Salmonella enterica subsp. enterica]
LGPLDRGVAGLRIGVLDEGFIGADPDVAEIVMAAVDVLSAAGAIVTKVSVPEHSTVGAVQMALMAEGGKAVFDTGYFGAFTKTYYPASLIAAVNTFWDTQIDLLTPRTKMNLIAAHLSRQTYRGRVYA